MIKAIAIDDEPRALDVIELYCSKAAIVDLVRTFRNSLEVIPFLKSNSIDLIFLDINIPEVDGLELAKLIDKETFIIFTTAYEEYAIKSYDFNTVDYLLKPFEFPRFYQAINKVEDRIKEQQKNATILTQNEDTDIQKKSFFLKSGHETHRIKFDQLLFVKSDGNYMKYQTFDTMIMVRETMIDAIGHLNSDFLRVHKSYIVNTTHITVVKINQILVCGYKIPVGSNFRQSLKEKLSM